MSLLLYIILKVLTVFSCLLLLSASTFFLFHAMQPISATDARSTSGWLFVKGIFLLMLVILPLFSLVFFRRRHSIYTHTLLTFFHFTIAVWIASLLFNFR
jgi:hypothetical protein